MRLYNSSLFGAQGLGLRAFNRELFQGSITTEATKGDTRN